MKLQKSIYYNLIQEKKIPDMDSFIITGDHGNILVNIIKSQIRRLFYSMEHEEEDLIGIVSVKRDKNGIVHSDEGPAVLLLSDYWYIGEARWYTHGNLTKTLYFYNIVKYDVLYENEVFSRVEEKIPFKPSRELSEQEVEELKIVFGPKMLKETEKLALNFWKIKKYLALLNAALGEIDLI